MIASEFDTKHALAAAAEASSALRALGGFGRADALHKATDEMIARNEKAAAMFSTETGKPIAQSRREWALAVSVATRFANAGQVCVTPDRFFVHERLHGSFVEEFVKRAKAIKLGDGLNPDTGMETLISAKRLSKVDGIVKGAINDGATVETGGRRSTDFDKGYFYEPTVLTNVRDAMKVFAQDNFGPIAAITSFKEDDEVIARPTHARRGYRPMPSHDLRTAHVARLTRRNPVWSASIVSHSRLQKHCVAAPIFRALVVRAGQKG